MLAEQELQQVTSRDNSRNPIRFMHVVQRNSLLLKSPAFFLERGLLFGPR